MNIRRFVPRIMPRQAVRRCSTAYIAGRRAGAVPDQAKRANAAG
jgi:hypothetical protein